MNPRMSLRIQTARRRLNRYNLPWEQVETAVDNILTATSDSLGIDHKWTFDYHYYALRVVPTIVLRAKHRHLPHAVAVKYLHQTGEEPASPAQLEFATLRELDDKLGPEHCSIVARPYASTRHGYACEWVDLPSMKTVLLMGAFSAARRQSCIEAAAANLRLINNALGVRSEPLKTDFQIKRLKKSGATSQAWMSTFEKFISLSHKFEGRAAPHGPVHADYTPGNILLGPNRCVIFDFGRRHENGPLYSDIAYFLAYVIAYCTFGSSSALQLRIDKDIDTFMSAYGNQDAHDLQIVRYFYLAHLLNRWGRHEAKGQQTGRSFHLSAYDRFAVGRMERLVGEVFHRYF